MSRLQYGEKNDRVIIFDYDGVITDGNPMAVKSMEDALKQALETLSVEKKIPFDKNLFIEAGKNSEGTTEEAFIREYLRLSNFQIDGNKTESMYVFSQLWDEFIACRTKILLEDNGLRFVKGNDSGYINKDFLELIIALQEQDKKEGIKTYYAVATGNPGSVIDLRIPDDIKRLIKNHIYGGDSGRNRKDIVQDLLNDLLFKRQIDKEKNKLFYLDDTARAVLDVANMNPEGKQKHWYDILPIHVDRKKLKPSEIDLLVKQGLAFRVERLDEPQLANFLVEGVRRKEVEGSVDQARGLDRRARR